jgi:hypothetical protein
MATTGSRRERDGASYRVMQKDGVVKLTLRPARKVRIHRIRLLLLTDPMEED